MADTLTFPFECTNLRATLRHGEPWFVAADVLAALTLDRKAMERLDEDEKGVSSIHTLGGPQEMTVINESGLYSLILGSRKPEAKRFKRWVTHEVLPAIRKTGKYDTKQRFTTPALPAPRKIRSREDLSFTKRNAKGHLVNWVTPSNVANWHERYGLGEAYFAEVVELARYNPKEAFNALRFAGSDIALAGAETGYADGFFERMARWAVAAMLTKPGGDPRLPFEVPALGIGATSAVILS